MRRYNLVRHLAMEDAVLARALAAAQLAPHLLPAVLHKAGHAPRPAEDYLLALLASAGCGRTLNPDPEPRTLNPKP